MKLSKCYASYKYSDITICQEPDVEKVSLVTGEKKMCPGRIYWSLQTKEEIKALIDSGKDLKWELEQLPSGTSVYKFSIKEDKKGE